MLLAIIFRIAGGEFARPVDRQSHQLQLLAHRRDIVVGPVARVDAFVARGVFGRQAEGVPAHGMQHIEALRAAEAGDDVAHRVVARMAHVDAPRRIGEHLQHIAFGLGAIGWVQQKRCGGSIRPASVFPILWRCNAPFLVGLHLPGAIKPGGEGFSARKT